VDTSSTYLQRQQFIVSFTYGLYHIMPRRGVPDEAVRVSRTAEDPALRELERRLNEDVDEDFFEEPRRFNTLHRVIDVLGLQMIDDATTLGGDETAPLHANPAYRNLQTQQDVVEGAIEHMAVIHCADLNGSVIQVGQVARHFTDAVGKVRTLRHQVREVQNALGANAPRSSNPNEATLSTPLRTTPRSHNNAAATSLRELWLKKLECEATLALLDRLDVIRAAPAKFDRLVQGNPMVPCRIGAAVLILSQALTVMFADDVAQVQALHKIMEQLLLRKQKAEEIVWDTLADVLYLRTANGTLPQKVAPQHQNAVEHKNVSGGHSVSSESRRSGAHSRVAFRIPAPATPLMHATRSRDGMVNPFVSANLHYTLDHNDDLDHDSVVSDASHASLFSIEDWDDDNSLAGGAGQPHHARTASSSGSVGSTEAGGATKTHASPRNTRRTMIPIPMMEVELDLEADERRCLEDFALSMLGRSRQQPTATTPRDRHPHGVRTPRYNDPVLALRILADCLTHLQRLDDLERVLHESLPKEIRAIIQREQIHTFARLEKSRPQSIRETKADTMQEFRRHLAALLSAFGNVMVRLSHLAQIVRFRISADRELAQKMESPSSFLRSVLSTAYEIMQREIKEFLKACLVPSDQSHNGVDAAMGKRSSGYERGLFSLGIVESESANKDLASTQKQSATRSNVMEMTASKFVASVLFSKTKSEPNVRHALTFRRSIARWTMENEAMKNELAVLTGEDPSSPSFRAAGYEMAITYLDNILQKDLLPTMQEQAVNGTVRGLERRDAFDPILDRGLYARPNSSEPQDVDMCAACQVLYDETAPLFVALHRLPRGGEMYLPTVAVLEHVVLTFRSRIKKQIAELCEKKTALQVLLMDGTDGVSAASVLERRRPFALLQRAYAHGETLEIAPAVDEGKKQSGILPLSPPVKDSAPRQSIGDLKTDTPVEDLADDVEGETKVFDLELSFLGQYLDFAGDDKLTEVICSDEELMKSATLAHGLLKLATLLDNRLMVRGTSGYQKPLTSTRALREAIKTIRDSGFKLAKFCRLDMILQTTSRLSKVCTSSTLVAHDAVRIPSSVNDLGEYMTGASDNLREACGNAVTAYILSSLEQYIPHCLMETVRVLAKGKGIITRAPLTMNGIEALDRSGSVLYRDLKGATSFDNSFWDVELAAYSFEQSASMMAMMELEMEELEAFYASNKDDFSDEDFELMFGMTGPRRKGNVGRFHMLKRR
jgi:hypothetical protein